MTREEAIVVLKDMARLEITYLFGKTERDALSIAIKALEQEPCEDVISRKMALKTIKNLYPDIPRADIMGARRKWLEKYAPYRECEKMVEHLPPVTPQPKTGHWIKVSKGTLCSICGCYAIEEEDDGLAILTDYCPWCGAKMVKTQAESEG